MAKYRHHRGGYIQSMGTVIEINSMDQLLNHLNSSLAPSSSLIVSDIQFEHKGFDERNGWDTHYVTAMIWGDRSVVGMIDGIVR